jgi:hypothetical protein
MKFIEYCNLNRILLVIFLAYATHTLQPLDVAIFLPLSNAYMKQLDDFMKESYGFTRLTKRDFFWLFWASWDEIFTKKNINSAFSTTSLYPFNLEIVLQKFTKKINSQSSSSESTASIILAYDWKRLDKLVKSAVKNICDQEAIWLRDSVNYLSTEVILLQDKITSLEKALINVNKRPNK